MADEYRHHMIVDLELRLPDAVAEPQAVVTGHLLAIVAESLSNIARHSHANSAILELRTLDDGATLELILEDDGIGFDPAGVVKLGHQGLANTRERAAQIGGTIVVDSGSGAGTRVVIRVAPRAGVRRTRV